MKLNQIVLALGLIGAAAARGAAQDSLEFTLDEVDSASAKTASKAEPAPSVDTKQAIQHELGALHWGMSKTDLLKVLRAQIHDEFEQRVKVERDIMRQDALYQQAQEQVRRLTENYVEFDGDKTGWDVSPIAPEFTQGNREAMLVVTKKGTRDMYFFIQGRLWKWYRELSPESLGADNPDDALKALKERFGQGKSQQERRNDSNMNYPGKVWSDGSTRVTAMLRGNDTCLIFEDLQTIEHLAVLRHNVPPKARQDRAAAIIETVLLSPANGS
jgi:hypothetical protein